MLTKLSLPEDSAVLETAVIRLSWGETSVDEKLWDVIDEQRIEASARRRLLANGFRVGVLAGYSPEAIVELCKPLKQPESAKPDDAMTLQISDWIAADMAQAARSQVRQGRRLEVTASEIREQESVFYREPDGRASGKTYRQAQYLFATEMTLSPDGGVLLTMIPELHHGEPKTQARLLDHGYLLENRREKRVFDELRFTANLRPGEILVATCDAAASGSLGVQCFQEQAAQDKYQKIILVRLAQTQHDNTFKTLDADEEPSDESVSTDNSGE